MGGGVQGEEKGQGTKMARGVGGKSQRIKPWLENRNSWGQWPDP